MVVSADRFNQGPAGLVVIVPVTTQDKRIPSHVAVPAGEGGLRQNSFIKCEEIRCVSRDRLNRSLGRIGKSYLQQVEVRMKLILGL